MTAFPLFAAAVIAAAWQPMPPTDATPVVRCVVNGDEHARAFELQRSGAVERPRWALVMRSTETGGKPVTLPLPDAKPAVQTTRFELKYHTSNGGRDVRWTIDGAHASLDVHANFELEVNVEPDLDPRVELMNTRGPLARLACEILEPAVP